MEVVASLERFFSRCPECGGTGFLAKNNRLCPACRGAGLILNLPSQNLVLTFPLFADFKSRGRAKFFRFLIFLTTAFFLASLLAYVVSLLVSFMGSYFKL
ncbi:MAG: hypothetical protein M1352_01770 [Patescibacteria group bacterium]|nr:hypothetical protein [Patescibacteria group bacterium]